jgi:pimeloyl-ACP methyl ester carboxylesterase
VARRTRRSARRAALAGSITLLAVASACSTAGDVTVTPLPASTAPDADPAVVTVPEETAAPSTTTETTGEAAAPTIEWESCDDFECGTLTVPLDHADPAGETIDLFVKRRPADDPDERIGSLLVNPGGPGIPAALMVDNAPAFFSPDLLEVFDIVALDPRGTGGSPRVDCVEEDFNPYFGATDVTPDSPEEVEALEAASQAFVDLCVERSGSILPFVSTADTARDFDLLRQALGEETISYFGGSYGSELGSVWVSLFPETVRAAVLDGGSNPVDWQTDVEQQVVALERTLTAALEECGADEDCPFYNDGDPLGAYDALVESLEQAPLDVGESIPVNEAVLNYAVVSSLYVEETWPAMFEALADAQVGDGRGLYELYDSYVHFLGPDDNDTFDALPAINCLDDPGPTDPADFPALDARFRELGPRMGVNYGYNFTCALWPARPREKVAIEGAGSAPVLVVGTTGDGFTPIESSRDLAELLDNGVFLTVDAPQHTGYGATLCSLQAVDRYLIDLEVPAEGTICR